MEIQIGEGFDEKFYFQVTRNNITLMTNNVIFNFWVSDFIYLTLSVNYRLLLCKVIGR